MDALASLVQADPVALALIVFRTVVVYLVLLVALRLAGRRELGQMTVFDFLVVLLLANTVQNAMVGPDSSLTGGIVSALTVLGANWVVGQLGLRSPWLRSRLIGGPVLLVHNGVLLQDHVRHEGLVDDEVLQALREHGVDDVAAVKTAVLEVDGTISVIPASAPSSRTRRRLRARKPAG